MTRDEAQQIVDRCTVKVGQYSAVPHGVAFGLLGPDAFDALLADPVRRLGPTQETIYPWNIVDYLERPELARKHA